MLCLIFLLIVCAIQVHRVEQHFTHRDMYLVGPVIERLNTGDWMQCLIACTTSKDCVSYNFEPRSGMCELLTAGLDFGRKCHGRKFLVRSRGWIFHQITGGWTVLPKFFTKKSYKRKYETRIIDSYAPEMTRRTEDLDWVLLPARPD